MNKKIIEQFELLIKQIESEYLYAQAENQIDEINMHRFRLISMKKIIKIIKGLDFEITSADDLDGIKGINKGTTKRITEILENGFLSEIEEKYSKEKNRKIEGIRELEEIIGVGSSLARKLVSEHGICSIDELRENIDNGNIKVNKKIMLGLKYHGVVKGNIPRKEIELIEKKINEISNKINNKLKIIVCGSYRRGKKTSGDIDILLYHPDFKVKGKDLGEENYLVTLVKELTKKKIIVDHLTDKNVKTKYMGFCKLGSNPVRRIDIRFIPFTSLATAMLYFTGPYELNTIMRSEAKKKEMILNEYGLYTVSEDGDKHLIKTKTEEDVFKKLKMKYIEPSERELYSR